MRVIERFKMGITLTVDSLRLMRHNPTLLLFPLISGAAALAFLGLFLGVTFGLMAITPEGGALVGLFLAYLVLTFVSTFFTAGLVHQTHDAIMTGSTPSVRDGLAAAWGVKGKLLIWALVSATVGVLINGLENSDSRGAQLFGTIFGFAWTVLTFFVIPVAIFEKTGAKGMFTESGRTFKKTWGETPISLFGVQLIGFVVALPFILVGVALSSIQSVLAIGTILLGLALAFLVGQTLQGIIKTTLYLYATEGLQPGEFDNVDFDGLAKEDDSTTKQSTATPGRI
ncbi:DUF6159 family protein [Halobacteria archaeon AArc-dxtr1]|nr:DUF6159 family protein [Halobacteria archaeon AArc-dxtr1]